MIAIFHGGVPVHLPIIEPVARIDRHVVFGHAEKLVEAGFRLGQKTFVRIACSKPATNFVYRLGDLTQNCNGFLVAPRSKEGDTADPRDPIEVEWIVSLREVDLVNCSIGLPDCTEI